MSLWLEENNIGIGPKNTPRKKGVLDRKRAAVLHWSVLSKKSVEWSLENGLNPDTAPLYLRNSSNEAVAEEGIEPAQPAKPTREKKPLQTKPKVNWPGASEKAKWEAINADISCILEKIKGTIETKLVNIIYSYRREHFGVIQSLNFVKAYFKDLFFCFTTPDFTTICQRLEVGIMAGCTISPLTFTMAMEVIIKASKWVVGGERQKSGVRLTPIRAYMDGMTTLTTTAPFTRRLLGKLEENLTRARMRINLSKSRRISISKGKKSDHRFYINGEPIPTVSEKPIKSLGWCYDTSLKDCNGNGCQQWPRRDIKKKFTHCLLTNKLMEEWANCLSAQNTFGVSGVNSVAGNTI